jgi:hypothetical protein
MVRYARAATHDRPDEYAERGHALPMLRLVPRN